MAVGHITESEGIVNTETTTARAVGTPTPPDRLSVIRDAIDRFTGRRRYQISEDDIDDLAVEIDGLLPATPDPSIPERPDPRNITDCGKDDCTTVEHWQRVAQRAIAALGSIPERPAEPLDLLREAAAFLALRPSGHTGSMDDRIPWFTHGAISHGEDRPDCVVCQWLARYAALALQSTEPPIRWSRPYGGSDPRAKRTEP